MVERDIRPPDKEMSVEGFMSDTVAISKHCQMLPGAHLVCFDRLIAEVVKENRRSCVKLQGFKELEKTNERQMEKADRQTERTSKRLMEQMEKTNERQRKITNERQMEKSNERRTEKTNRRRIEKTTERQTKPTNERQMEKTSERHPVNENIQVMHSKKNNAKVKPPFVVLERYISLPQNTAKEPENHIINGQIIEEKLKSKDSTDKKKCDINSNDVVVKENSRPPKRKKEAQKANKEPIVNMPQGAKLRKRAEVAVVENAPRESEEEGTRCRLRIRRVNKERWVAEALDDEVMEDNGELEGMSDDGSDQMADRKTNHSMMLRKKIYKSRKFDDSYDDSDELWVPHQKRRSKAKRRDVTKRKEKVVNMTARKGSTVEDKEGDAGSSEKIDNSKKGGRQTRPANKRNLDEASDGEESEKEHQESKKTSRTAKTQAAKKRGKVQKEQKEGKAKGPPGSVSVKPQEKGKEVSAKQSKSSNKTQEEAVKKPEGLYCLEGSNPLSPMAHTYVTSGVHATVYGTYVFDIGGPCYSLWHIHM